MNSVINTLATDTPAPVSGFNPALITQTITVNIQCALYGATVYVTAAVFNVNADGLAKVRDFTTLVVENIKNGVYFWEIPNTGKKPFDIERHTDRPITDRGVEVSCSAINVLRKEYAISGLDALYAPGARDDNFTPRMYSNAVTAKWIVPSHIDIRYVKNPAPIATIKI